MLASNMISEVRIINLPFKWFVIYNKLFVVGGSTASYTSLKKLTFICQKITKNKISLTKKPKTSIYDIPCYISDNSKVSKVYKWKPKKNTNQIRTSPIENLSNIGENSKIEVTSFQDLLDKSEKEKEIELKYDLERNVKLVSFNKGKIDICFNEKLNKNFIKNLTEKLLMWTGERWIISLSKNKEAKSVYEKNLESKNKKIEEYKNSKEAKEFQAAFPDAKLLDIKEE